jgi:hypothetical protein
MYGLVNQAVREMVVTNYGEEKWEEIREKAGTDDVFIAMDQYPDDVTVGLVGGACAVLGAQPAQVLEGFGEFWVDFTVRTYGELFAMSGDDFVGFIKNLNDLHTRVEQMMPDLAPPSFIVTDETPGEFKLQYHSKRAGLHPMIFGLLRGLGKHFKTQVESTRLRGKEEGLSYEEFLVKHRPA